MGGPMSEGFQRVACLFNRRGVPATYDGVADVEKHSDFLGGIQLF